MSETTRDVNLTKMVQPKFLTLTGLPANQVAFKVLRDDKGEERRVPYIKRTRTTRTDALLRIEFEEGVTEEDAAALAESYGLSGYTTKVDDSGRVSIQRSDANDCKNTVAINLGGGRTATIVKPASVARGVAVVSIDFAKDYFETEEEVSAWLSGHGIDFDPTRVQNGDLSVSVLRADKKDGDELRRMQVDDGVEFVIARADEDDIPEGYVEVVSETAYGRWGWGQLDFYAAMADVEFCRVAEEASYRLRDVLDRILFYSDLSVQLRKELAAQAAMQFAEFIGGLLDALPTAVVAVSRSTFNKEKSMGQKQESKPVERSDATAGNEGAAAAAQTAAAAQAPAAVSREDVAAMIDEKMGTLTTRFDALADAITGKKKDEQVARADDTPKADPMAEALQTITRSVDALNTSIKTVNDAVASMTARVTALESSSVVRSDEGDGKQSAKRADPFAGAIFGRRDA